MRYKTVDFSKYSSIKIGPTLEVAVLEHNSQKPDTHHLIGSCNNTLIGDNPPPLMMLSKEYDYIRIEDTLLKIGGATPSGKIASFCKKNNIANFEFLSHLPGKLGGLVSMNAGLKEHEIFNHLYSITTPSGIQTKDTIEYGYRYTDIKEPVLQASFSLEYGFDAAQVGLFKKMRANQPSTPSAGSCFKNPKNDYAGRLIEAVGLKGYMRGAMCFSKEHANFLVNTGGGVFEDALWLIQEAQKRVYKTFDIWLKCEVVVLEEGFMDEDSPLTKPKNV